MMLHSISYLDSPFMFQPAFEKKAVFGPLQSRYSCISRLQFNRELSVLQSLVETDKSVLPGIIAVQNRGKMTFPHQSLLPFCRRCSQKIKQHLNQRKYCMHGRRIVIVSISVVVKIMSAGLHNIPRAHHLHSFAECQETSS